ncbi:hypothetical protein V0288_22395 [Pannus brasiliensis CCIBt3594]|uniref:TFIIS-type domain-containing protein n=1 Tax=Pannus brasiliensis CCIBt3594 TaxID=1427578 RepID=A0AAW9QX98_9CHRO
MPRTDERYEDKCPQCESEKIETYEDEESENSGSIGIEYLRCKNCGYEWMEVDENDPPY